MPVKSLWGALSSADSISLFWTKPDEYQDTYSYRVQTNVTSSSSTLISDRKVTTNETATIKNLTPGETYTFTVFTTAADNVTKSDPVSLTTTTWPLEIPDSVQIVRSSSGDAMNITFQGFDTTNGPIMAYAVIMTTDLSGNKLTKGSLSKTYNDFKNGLTSTYVTSVIEPQNIQSNKISAHMGDGTVSRGYVNGPLDPTLHYRVYIVGFTTINFDPATDTINEDQSTATVANFSGSSSTTSTFKTDHAEIPGSVQIVRSSSRDAMNITFQSFETPNGPIEAYAIIMTTDLHVDKPTKESLSKTYNDFRNGLTRTYVTSVIEKQNIQNTDQLKKISVHVGDGSVSRGYVNGPLDPTLHYRVYIAGFTAINYDTATDTINEDQSTGSVTSFYGSASTTTAITAKKGPAEIPGGVQVVRSYSGDAMNITFQSVDTSYGPTVAYAILMTTDFSENNPTKGSLAKTYNDFKNGLTTTYVTSVIEQQNIQNADQLNKLSVHVGDGTVSRGYVNGPLDPALRYRVYIVGFTALNYDPATDTINEDQSKATVSSFSSSASTTTTFETGHAKKPGSLQIVRSSSGDAMNVTFQSLDTSFGPTVTYAIVMTSDFSDNKPTKGYLSKTYNDFKNGLTKTYVTSVIEQRNIHNADELNKINVNVGDGTVSRGYVNGPLDPALNYRVYIVGFSAINYDVVEKTINEDKSTSTFTSFSGSTSKTTTITSTTSTTSTTPTTTVPAEIPGGVQIVRSSTGKAMDLTFQSVHTSYRPIVAYAIIMTTDLNGNKPTKGSLAKTYNDFRKGLTTTYVTSVIEQQKIRKATQLNRISVHVGDGSASRGYVNGRLDPALHYRVYIVGFTAIKYDPATNTINEDRSAATVTSFSDSASITTTTNIVLLEEPVNVQAVRSYSGDAMNITFQSFETSYGSTVAYAIIMTTDSNDEKPTKESLPKTYNDFINGLTTTYVTSVVEQQETQKTSHENEISVNVGDGTVSRGYINGPLDPDLQYRVSIAGFSTINYDQATGTINGDQSTAAVTSFSDSDLADLIEEPSIVQDVRSSLNEAMDTDNIFDTSYHSAPVREPADNSGIIGGVVGGIFGAVALAGLGFLIWRKRRQRVGYQKNVLISPITGDVTNLYEEPEMLSAVSCTTAAQALMEVEKGSARTMERHKGQGTKTEEWNLGVLVSDKQKYSRQNAGYAKPVSIRQNSGDVTYLYEETELTKEATRTSTFKASHEVEKESARMREEHKYEGAETEDWNMEALISENMKYSGQHTSDVEYSYKESKMAKASSCTIPVQAPLAVAKANEGHKSQEAETDEWTVRELVSEKQKNRRQTPGYEKNMLIRKSTGDVRYLFEEPKVMKAVSCIIPLQADLEVKTESAWVTAGHKGQVTETEDWNMEVLLSEKQIYSRKQSVKIENFHAAYQRLRTSDYRGLILQFDSLKSIEVLQSRSITMNLAKTQKEQLDAETQKTRIGGHSVQNELHSRDGTSHARTSALEGSIYGYISASYISGYRFSREFIAAQNPQSDTVGYFWYLIWEKHINTIVMLSSCQENGKECSEQYWPSREAKVFGDIMVTFVSEDIHRNGTVRNLLVTNLKSSESRQVRQFQYTLWTTSWDFIDRDILMKFVSSVQQYRKKNSPNYPTLVHCSSGACRSGIFIALDWIISQLREESSVDVYGISHCLNQQRPLMVHTAAHYMFLYQCTLELIIRQTEDISGFYEYYEQVKEESV
ncbi:receptor-type tyrosine-protein phosphatase eta-like isoform X2 [Rana temporaria]|uniref:receptor-type tyrosine-protein phosphatase eta-like isoform X2 n=1 Tax=Rana temporaria TaxID=8407 RepID=UPI001AACD85D|nr:receptor-type tyrosine-protein phosphatase eta-like isoform X2 [Rana temporaria]